ncbi:MAG: hypothetical protein V3U57_03570 [Robiginitomaculum sp.]
MSTMDNKPKPKSKTAGRTAKRAIERRFRHSYKAQMRRNKAKREDNRFMHTVFGIAAFGTLVVFIIVYGLVQSAFAAELGIALQAAQNTGEAAASEAQRPQSGFLIQPLVGKYTPLDIMGIAFVMVAGYAVWLRYKNRE